MPLLGRGLLTSEGELWKRQRRAVQPAFRPHVVARFDADMTAAAVEVADRWLAAPAGEPVRVDRDLTALTLTVVARAILGSDVAIGPRFGEAVDAVNRFMSHYDPGSGDPEIARDRAAFGAALGFLDRIVRLLVDGRRIGGEPDAPAQDVLDALLRDGTDADGDPRPGADDPDGRSRDDGEGADLDALAARPPPGRARACGGGGGRRPRRTAADRGRRAPPDRLPERRRRGAAALSARVADLAARARRGRARGLPRRARHARLRQPVPPPPPSRVSGSGRTSSTRRGSTARSPTRSPICRSAAGRASASAASSRCSRPSSWSRCSARACARASRRAIRSSPRRS